MSVSPPSPDPDATSPASPQGLSRRRALGVMLGGAAGVAATAAAPTPAWAADAVRPGALRAPALRAADRAIVTKVSARRALRHIEVLSEDIGPRIGGTASEKAAADYLAAALDGYGYDTVLQPFPVTDKFTGQLTGVRRQLPTDLDWQVAAAGTGALDTTVTGVALDLGAGEVADFAGVTATGRIVLMDYGTSATRNAQVARAVAAGAVGVVFLAASQAHPRRAGTFTPAVSSASIPVVGAAQAQKERLRAALVAGALTLRLSTTAHRGLTSNNVLATRRGQPGWRGWPNVMVCAHYDSVIGAPGANDDASGTSLVLELARVLRNLPTWGTVSFSCWGSEEQGLIGSRYYVNSLSGQQRDQITGVFNNDMVATSWDQATRYWVLSLTGQPNVVTDAVTDSARRLGYAPQISPVTPRGASDHQSFQEVGVASGNFTWRGEETPALLEPPYHTPEDTIEHNISLQRLQVSLEIVGTAMYRTARPL
jgi:aminopeptidase YwaD